MYNGEDKFIRKYATGKKLNVGSGIWIRPKSEGWFNIDAIDRDGLDKVVDLTKLPLPFPDNSFDFVYASHILEHLECPVLPVMEELVRIMKVDGYMQIAVPLETNTWDNVTHMRTFSAVALKGWINIPNYKKKVNVKVVELEYYAHGLRENKPLHIRLYLNFSVWICNLIGIQFVTRSFIKYLFPCVDARAVYQKYGVQNENKM